MNSTFSLLLKTEQLADSFRQWLLAFNADTGTKADIRFRFIRTPEAYCVATVIPADSHFDMIYNAAAAYGTCFYES